jgi:hypothetical protein
MKRYRKAGFWQEFTVDTWIFCSALLLVGVGLLMVTSSSMVFMRSMLSGPVLSILCPPLGPPVSAAQESGADHGQRGPAYGAERSAARGLRTEFRDQNSEVGKELCLRGINARVVEAGTIRVGDIVKKLG